MASEMLPEKLRDIRDLYYKTLHTANLPERERLDVIDACWVAASEIEILTAAGKKELFEACWNAHPMSEELPRAIKELIRKSTHNDVMDLFDLIEVASEKLRVELLLRAVALNPGAIAYGIQRIMRDKNVTS